MINSPSLLKVTQNPLDLIDYISSEALKLLVRTELR